MAKLTECTTCHRKISALGWGSHQKSHDDYIRNHQRYVTDYLDFSYPTMKPADRLRFDIGNIYENKIQCKNCGWVIRSKNRHDFVRCICGDVAVDGGSWYQRIIGKLDGYIDHTTYFKYKHVKDSPTSSTKTNIPKGRQKRKALV